MRFNYFPGFDEYHFRENNPDKALRCYANHFTVVEAPDKPTPAPKPSRKPRKCPDCGNADANITFGPDPYNEDINGDSTPVWMCAACRYNSAMDI
jgi:hypothetical protein